jgi:hypothetical protein
MSMTHRRCLSRLSQALQGGGNFLELWERLNKIVEDNYWQRQGTPLAIGGVGEMYERNIYRHST